MQKYIWNLQPFDKARVFDLAEQLQVSQLLASLLINRGLGDPDAASRFLSPSLQQLHDPFLMKGMERVIERVTRATSSGEKCLIYGDYDVDGITGVVILKKSLELAGVDVQYHVPERLTEGYGLQPARIREAALQGVKLIISVDSGIRAEEAARAARTCGIDLIITDHHLPDRELPPAYEILNPNRFDCNYPDKNLAGVGVVFKLVQALLQRSGKDRLIPSFLKLVCVGTIADIVPLVGENRVFAKIGLEGLKSPRNYGLKALLDSAGVLGKQQIDYSAVGFRIAPRINAVGRMGETADAVRLFDSLEEAEARQIARKMNDKNLWRQQEQDQILKSIEEKFRAEPEVFSHPIIVLWDQCWHRGVIGIVASRVMETYDRPALIASVEGDVATGSGRSFGDLHLLECLQACSSLLQQYGGHRHAAGFTTRASLLPELRSQLNEYALHRFPSPVPSIIVDALLSIRHLNDSVWREVSRLEPFGFGNPVPVFQDDEVLVQAGPFVLKEKHIKWKLASANCPEAIWWNQPGKLETLKQVRSFRAIYQLEMNEFRGERNLVARIRDLAL